jgi:hypothetical protein
MTQGFFHRLVSNLPTLAIESSSNPGGKGKEEVLPVGLSHFPEIGIGAGSECISPQIFPVFCPILVVHRRNSNCCPRSVEITLEHRSELGCTRCHKRDWGRGKRELK